MEAVVQWVRTSWTKQSRGERGATRRNAAPTAFPLPPLQPPFVHQILMNEYDDFQPHATLDGNPPKTMSDSGVHLRDDNGLLRVHLTVTPTACHADGDAHRRCTSHSGNGSAGKSTTGSPKHTAASGPIDSTH